MKRAICSTVIFVMACAAYGDTVVPVRTIRAHSIIDESDLDLRAEVTPGAVDSFEYIVGQEARTTLYAGRAIRFDDIGPPALVARNQIVSLKFAVSGLVIMTEGRSLERGTTGDRIRIMNLDSRTTLFGEVQEDGSVRVYK